VEKTIPELRANHDLACTLPLIVLLDPEAIDLHELEAFLKEYMEANPEALREGKANVKTELRRLVKIYDWMRYGPAKEPPEGGSEGSGDAPTT
jgi:hypothetical protein